MEEFESLIADSVRLRLRADVPVAAYLSGGIDSSATTWLIKQIEPGVLNTFSLGFESKEFDETAFQQSVANQLETTHHSITCKNTDVADNFATGPLAYRDPLASDRELFPCSFYPDW